MPFHYLVLDRELFWLVQPHTRFDLINLAQELIIQLTSESDAATRTPPGPFLSGLLPPGYRRNQKVLFVVTK